VATETDAARDRVIAARADLAAELEVMEASVRAAVDIPAKIKRSPAKAAAVVGGLGFVALKGPQRVFGAAKRAVTGPPTDFPPSMLPDQIEKTLRSLGSDGAKVRGALERDFAGYAKQSRRDKASLRRSLLLTVTTPLLARGGKAAAEWLFRPSDATFAERLAEVRERTEREVESALEGGKRPGTDDAADAGA
jgi:hypothetical protein